MNHDSPVGRTCRPSLFSQSDGLQARPTGRRTSPLYVRRTCRPSGLFLLLVLLTVSTLHAATFVHETVNEFSAGADFDGDGNGDVLVVDKATGLYRVGYGNGSGGFAFANGRPSGMPQVTGVAVGKLNGIAADSLAVTSPAQNRANILSPASTGYVEPKDVLDAGLGPVILSALDITGGGAPTPEDDLAVVASLDLTNQFELRQVRSNAGAWSLLRRDDIANATVAHGNPMIPHLGSPPLFAYVRDDGATNSFHAWSLTGVAATNVLNTAGLTDGSRFVSGLFDGPDADVMMWGPGQSSLVVGRVTAAGPGWTFSSLTTFSAGLPLAQLVPVNSPAGLRLLMRFDNGTVALYGYTLAGGFSPPLAIAPVGATGVLSGVVPMPGNAFQLLYAAAPGGPTNSMVGFGNGGTGWTQTGITTLPGLQPLSIYTNVMLLEDGLFRRDNVDLIRSYQAGDWVAGAVVGGAGPFTITASAATFGGSTQGIGAPSPQIVGSVSTAPGGTAVSQMHPQFSIFSFNANLGPSVDSVTISPAPGTYSTAQRITFSGLMAGTTVYLRMNGSGGFQLWNAASAPWITRNTIVEYYASRAAGVSPTQTAQYHFSKPAALQDTDGDGVPDFVEIAYGMDPSGGSDSDGDGFSDSDELAAATNPNDALSMPASLAPSLDSMIVDVKLRLLDAAGGATAHGKPGSATVAIHDPFGNALGTGVIGTGAVAVNFGRVNTVGVDAAMGFLVVRSSTHFYTNPAATSDPEGRELIGIVPALEPESWSWGISNGGIGVATAWGWGGVNWVAGSSNWNGGLGDMPGADTNWSSRLLDPLWDSSPAGTYSAAGWVSEYQAAINRGAQPYAEITLSPYTSLEAVIVGKIVGDLLTQRDPAAPVDGTAFVFEEIHPTHLKALRRTDPAHPTASVVRLIAVHRHVHDQLAAADPGAVALRKLARDVYAQHNALLTDNLAALPMPLDALAEFANTGALPADYLVSTSLTVTDRTNAATKLASIMSTVPTRPSTTQTFYTRSTANPPGLSLVQNAMATPQLLLSDQLTAIALPTNAEAPPGTPLQVTAYTDLPQIAGYTGLEVISLALTSLPFVVDEDSDDDLLADTWEYYHFGTLTHDGFDNFDGTPYSVGQEYLEGTDPRSGSSGPPVGPIAIRFQAFEFINAPPHQLRALWPPRYAGAVNVAFETSEDLGTWDVLSPLVAIDTGTGWFLRNVGIDRPRRFFRPTVELKRP